MKVVVTGASGFLGRRLMDVLHGADLVPVGVSRRAVAGLSRVGSYADTPAGDVLVHLAEDSDRARVNAAGAAYEAETATTMARLLARPFRRIIYVSSGAVYGDASTQPRRPTDATQAADTYSRVKLAGEQAVLGRTGSVVARLANMYGPGMSERNVVSTILEQIPGEGAVRVADDTPIRDFIWADDAAAALAAMVRGSAAGVFNVGTGRGTSIRALAELAIDVAGHGDRPIVATSSSERRSHLVLDIELTLASFPWRPETTLRQGLAILMGRTIS